MTAHHQRVDSRASVAASRDIGSARREEHRDTEQYSILYERR